MKTVTAATAAEMKLGYHVLCKPLFWNFQNLVVKCNSEQAHVFMLCLIWCIYYFLQKKAEIPLCTYFQLLILFPVCPFCYI